MESPITVTVLFSICYVHASLYCHSGHIDNGRRSYTTHSRLPILSFWPHW